jgi:oligoribonuclease (3'-5' exoribonuclease)
MKIADRFIFLDTELGGLDTDCSLLTAYFAVTDSKFNILSALDLKMKPDDGKYVITAQGMDVNKIDIVSHDINAITYKSAGTMLYDFLKTNKGDDLLVAVGQNVGFDVVRLTGPLMKRATFETFVSYRKLEIGTITRFLQMTGKLAEDAPMGLLPLRDYFSITKGNDHDAKDDVLASIEVLKKLMELGK